MRLTVFPLACTLAALAACNSNSSNEAEGGTAPETSAVATGQPAVPAASPAASASPAEPAAKDAAGSAAGLAAYVGKYPFDKVDGVDWNNNPVVLAGIRKTVTDAAARKAILELEGPASPITLYQGKVASWACEAHNCGDHQWTVMVDPQSGATDVCYHNAAKLPEKSRWFMADGSIQERQGNCPVE